MFFAQLFYLSIFLYLSFTILIQLHMDVNKLKNRLNVKFQPIKAHRKSLKKLQTGQLKQKSRNDQSILEKVRSNSQVKLPSINRSKIRYDTLQDSKSYVNVAELREKAKSFRQIPKVKVQSKEAINNTLTYLMKNQILTVPRIVALLQKNQSEEFIYFKVIGIYEFEACDQKQKGNNYVTVSRNGMVQNGQLIPLQTLVREFQIYKKVRKIDYFKNFQRAKFLFKWKQIFKKKRYIQNRVSVGKLLNLSDRNFLDWKIEVFNLFQIKSEGGWFHQNWIQKFCDNLKEKKLKSKKRLIQICFKMLQTFDLPISQSTQLLNRVLGNLGSLNISFEKKIRIQKQCDKFYKLGRQLQLSSMQNSGVFVLDHLKSLIKRANEANILYKSVILERLQDIDIFKEQYIQQKQKILSDSAVLMDIDYTLYFKEAERCLAIRPTPQQIYSACISQIRAFIKQMDKMGFKIIRTDQFKFVSKNVFKSGQEENQIEQEQSTFKRFVYSIQNYHKLTFQLEQALQTCQESFKRRINLFKPFLDLYLSILEKNDQTELTFQWVNYQYEAIQQNLKFCQKLDEGQYFILGFLNTLQFKKDLTSQIKRKQQRMFKRIPLQLQQKRIKINKNLQNHLQIINNQADNAWSFIQVAQQIQKVQENLLQYSSGIQQIQKIQQFYEKNSKRKLKLIKDQKKKLNQLKIRFKSFIETRQNNFLKYRKSLQNQKTILTKKIQAYKVKQDSFYDPKSEAKITYQKLAIITKNLKQFDKQLIQLNNLQSYYNLKPTIFNFLQMRIKQYQTLQQIWKFTWNVDADSQSLSIKLIKQIKQEKLIKFYDPFRKKAQKYLKDPDLYPITEACIHKLDIFIDNMETIQLINQQHLRQSDIDEINYHIERKMSIKNFGTIRCRQLFYQKFIQLKISQIKSFIAEVVFKARKQIQISQNLVQFNDWWKTIRLQFQYMEQYPLVAIFGENLKLRDQIDQFMTMLINILNNKYGSFVRNQCNQLLKKMNNLVQLLQLTQIHQQKFLNLFPILTSKYAESQLSTQYKKFEGILNKTMKNVRVLAKPTENLNEGTKSILNNHIKHFDSISHVLSKFLESKRLKFQRFYFLQDYQLLQVLVGIADQKNVFRMFEGIKGWLVSQEGIKTGVIGIGDEHLVLRGWNYKNVQPQLIFKNLQQALKSNLNSIVRNVLYQYEIELKQLRNLYEGIPWMCLYAIQMILYTKQVQINCFHENVALEAQESLIKQAINYAAVKPSQYSNYITMLLHLLHFTEQMRKQNVTSIFDFQWHSFLKFYYEKDNVMMRSLSNQIKWGGEYQGMWSLMVNTSDIRRAHICVLNNIQYANGVLLQGPSGTGKTQSLKQLARCTAKYCVIFNCSQNVNLKTISKLLSGLCYTASWLCLDQINRLTVQAMSVIAKQIQTIKNAILAKKQIFNFMGKDIKLRKGVTIFSTMNPIYLKRAKLTQNIKSYFRIITVAMPDHQIILQVMLYGLKFLKPRQLAQKISSTFSNLSIQLSKALQYDFGLRAMKFLVGNLSKQKKQTQKQNQMVSKAFYDIFFYRLTSSDKIIFQKVIYDIFKYKQETGDLQIQKRVSLMKQSPQTGIIVFGPVSAKSTLIRQYCNSFNNVQTEFFNFNSVDMRYFLGQSIHGRWEEGIVQKIARASLSNSEKTHILYIDSVLKSQIIQNFNTLLDQSKLLVLSNGSRLKIQGNFKMIMQTPHLNLISPSTITRCNLIFVSDKDVDSKSLIEAQLPIGLNSNQLANRIRKIYSKLSNNQIREVGKLSRIMYCERYDKNKKQWKDNQVLGIEKAVVFAARLLGIQKKIQDFIQKQNSFSAKKYPFHYILAYQRYAQGQFLQISRNYEPIYQYQNFLLKTSQEIFMKWLTMKAISKHHQPILWKGSESRGKSRGIIFSLKSKKYMKVPLNNYMGSTKLIKLLVPLILQKKTDQVKQKPQLIIYLQNLHMCNEQTSEQIRYMMEHNKIFSIQTRGIVPIQAMAFLSESRHFQNKQFDRVRRHFSELQVPEVDQIQLKNIYYQFIKYYVNSSSIDATIKSSINLQSQKFCTFLAHIYQAKNLKKEEKNSKIGPYSMIKILQRVSSLNFINCKQINDFMAFMFQVIKLNDNFRENPQEDILINAYVQFYKGKFVKQYENYLRNSNLIFTKLEDPTKKQTNIKTYIANQINIIGKNLYISQYIRSQVQIVLRILQNQSHYCLIGPQGSGRRTIFKLACNIQKLSYIELPPELNEKQIRKIYFERMKKAFQGGSKQIIILDIKLKSHIDFLEFAESVSIGSAVTQIFQSEETDYMFANILDYIGPEYNKASKSYEQVCQDYVKFSHKKIQFLIASSVDDKGIKIFQYFPTLQKKLYHRSLPQFQIQSLIEVINNILQKKIKENQDLKLTLPTQKLPKVFMKIYKIFYSLTNKNKLNNLFHFNFNQFQIFKILQLFCQEYLKTLNKIKQNTDILNKSIIKISQINSILAKLKQQIQIMQPNMQIIKSRILQIVPILQDKKKKTEVIKYVVQSQKKEIETKKQQISTITSQIQDKLAQVNLLLTDTLESLQTIKRSQLSQLKNNPNPHPLVKFTMQNMVILLGESENWQNVRKNLSDVNLIVRLKNCQPTHQVFLRIKKRIQQNSEWTFQSVSKISFGVRYILKWIKNLVRHQQISIQIEKKKQYIQKLKHSLRKSDQKVQLKVAQLNLKQKDSIDVQKQYSKISKELNDLQSLVDSHKRKLNNAEKIKDSLQQNTKKWENKLLYFKQIKSYLTSYCILLCLEISVFPALNPDQLNIARKDITKVLSQQSLPLPKDLNSHTDMVNIQQNALFKLLNHEDLKDPKKVALTYHFKNYPLVLDPDNQATNWLAKLDFGKKIMYTKKNFASATKIVEEAMKYGEILIVLVDGQIDNFAKQIFKSLMTNIQTSQYYVEYNKNTFKLNHDFKLLFFCKSKNPLVSLSSALNHQVINFQITKLSLHDSLINAALKIQKPDLFAIKSNIQQSLQMIQKKISEVQLQIIDKLLNNKRNLIEDQQFVQLLNISKSKYQAFHSNKKEQQSQILQIQHFIRQFTFVCNEAADIYMSLKDMSKINPLLIWDVEIFIQYFASACLASISEVVKDQQQLQENQNVPIIGGYQFQQYQQSNSRPTTALSSMSFSISRVNSEQNQQQRQNLHSFPTSRTEHQNGQKQEQQPLSQQKKEQQINHGKLNSLNNSNNNRPNKSIFQNQTIFVDQNKKGFVTQDRFYNILANLLNFFKKSFTWKERNIWALILALKNDKKQDIKYLINLISDRKKRALKTVIEQNMVTQGIKTYFSKFQSQKLQNQALRLLSFKDNISNIINNGLSLTQLLMIGSIALPQNFIGLTQKIIKNKRLQTILQYQQLKASDWLNSNDNLHPILLLMGQDPVHMISQFLQRRKYKNATLVTIGEDQGRGLDTHIEKQCRKQGIFIINNLHIAVNFIPLLIRLVQQFHFKPPHKNFRLILISSLDASLPQEISSMCHKYIVEQPSGLKNKMRGFYQKSQSYIDHAVTTQHKLTYSLCLMHSLINQMSKYGSLCWNFPATYTTSDFLGCILAIKSICQKQTHIEDYQCNLDPEQIQKELNQSSIDFAGLRYLIGQTCYIAKMSDTIDRKKMRIIIQNHFNASIMKPGYVFWQGSRISQHPQQVNKRIQQIDEQNPKTCGLYQTTTQSRQFSDEVLNQIGRLLLSSSSTNSSTNTQKFLEIKPINHKLGFIMQEIDAYNTSGIYEPRFQLLKQIDQNTKIFNLKAFVNPQQLFVCAKLEVAIKNNVPYDQVALLWSNAQKQGSYGVSNLTLQGGCIKNGILVPGSQQKQITLFFQAVTKKKDKDPNKGKTGIPLYLSEQRGESIGNYGQNTNLLTEVFLDSKQPPENWVVKGTAFISS